MRRSRLEMAKLHWQTEACPTFERSACGLQRSGPELAPVLCEEAGNMQDESATATYSIPEPFDDAVSSLRGVLAEAGLKIVGRLDLSARMQHRLLVETPPCLVLFAGPATPLRGGPSGHPGAAGLTPLHIVVSARGPQTEIHILRIPPRDGMPEDPAMADLGRFRARLSQAIEKIGMRAGPRG
jgi:uncharacterized protein (DUF302 family)